MANTKPMILAVDFDGTLCENEYPGIGKPITQNINYVKTLKQNGWKIVLWTCRDKKQLYQAVHWCKKQGLEFDAVNTDIIAGVPCKKLYADIYLDDHNSEVFI